MLQIAQLGLAIVLPDGSCTRLILVGYRSEQDALSLRYSTTVLSTAGRRRNVASLRERGESLHAIVQPAPLLLHTRLLDLVIKSYSEQDILVIETHICPNQFQ
jgi:hypothetical protein